MPLILGTLGKAAATAALSILARVATAGFMEWLMLQAAEAVAKNTKTPHDDKFVEKVKEANAAAKGVL